MTDIPCSTSSAVVTLHVRTPGWDHTDPDWRRRVQRTTDQAPQRLRHRLIQQPTTQIARGLAEELARVTGGHLADEDPGRQLRLGTSAQRACLGRGHSPPEHAYPVS